MLAGWLLKHNVPTLTGEQLKQLSQRIAANDGKGETNLRSGWTLSWNQTLVAPETLRCSGLHIAAWIDLLDSRVEALSINRSTNKRCQLGDKRGWISNRLFVTAQKRRQVELVNQLNISGLPIQVLLHNLGWHQW